MHISSVCNTIADALSRGEIQRVGSKCRRQTEENRTGIPESFEIEASKLIGASLAPSITIMYDNAVKSFDNFRINHNLPVTWPPSINPLLQYIGYMSVNGFALSKVRSYLSGIIFNLKIQGFCNLTDNFIIK